MRVIEIDGKTIARNMKCFTIAEAGINHNGSIQTAYQMIEVAKESGVDAIKFQTFKADEFCNKDSCFYPIFKECELKSDYWQYIKERCDLFDITFLSTPQNSSDLEILLKCNIKAIKIGSDDLTHIALLRKYSETKLPIILSCGMANEMEIDIAIETIKESIRDYPLILMHCTSQYPTNPKDVNMRKLNKLSSKYPEIILGYSDHTLGHTAVILAVSYGARIFETHFTLDNSANGPDHSFSKNPADLKIWVKSIHEAFNMLGKSDLTPTTEEKSMRTIARRSITAMRDICVGELFTNENIGMMRPGDGLSSIYLANFLSLKSSRDINCGDKLQKSDVQL
jgi:sialic acid synthase SpsE